MGFISWIKIDINAIVTVYNQLRPTQLEPRTRDILIYCFYLQLNLHYVFYFHYTKSSFNFWKL